MILYVPKLISFSNKLKINDLCVDNISKNKNIYFGNLWEDYINKEKLNQENMKKKKVSEKENEWKGVLQDKDNQSYFYQVGESNVTPDSFTVTSTNIDDSIKLQTYDGKIHNMNLDKIYIPKLPLFETLLEEENCNVGFNKDWDLPNSRTKTLKELANFISTNDFKNPYKEKRVDFEFTPLTFWQLLPSIAVNLHCKEIELTWLCFGMYINFKRNG